MTIIQALDQSAAPIAIILVMAVVAVALYFNEKAGIEE